MSERKWWAAAAMAVALSGGVVVARVHVSEPAPKVRQAEERLPSMTLDAKPALKGLDHVVFEAREAPPVATVDPPIVASRPPPEPVEPDDEQTAEARRRTAQAEKYVPQPSASAAAERDEIVAALAKTGAGGEEWRAQLESIEREWLKLDADSGVGAELSSWACYRGGCSIDVTLPSLEAQETFSRLITGGPALGLWKGPGFHSGPVRLDSGEIRVTWVLYAPPVGV